MKRLYCDRCKKEVEKLDEIKIPYKATEFGSYITKEVEVCKSCKSFIETAEKEYNISMSKIRVAFYETLLNG